MSIGSIHAATSGVMAGLRSFEARANNVANANTNGYKSKRVNNAEVPGGGVRASSTTANHSIGVLRSTGGATNLAIDGPGYFIADSGDGSLVFTRDGSFTTDAAGNLVTSSGNRLLPQIQIPFDAQSISVGRDGTISVTGQDGQTQILGQLQLATFANPDGLASVGGNLYEAIIASGEPIIGTPGTGDLGSIVAGFAEGSNVDLAGEMVGMKIDQRTVEANLKVLKVQDEILGSILDITR